MGVGLIISIIGVAVTLGTVLIGVGVLKNRLNNAVEINLEQSKKIEACATRDELATAIKRSDEMLELMRKRAEEDRMKNEGKFAEFYGILSKHSERITALETSQKSIQKTLEDIRKDLNGGFKDIREELRELRKQG